MSVYIHVCIYACIHACMYICIYQHTHTLSPSLSHTHTLSHTLTHLHTHRESAQCAEEDEKDFQNTDKHKFFNTNNLWIRLDKLKEVLDSNDGIVPLPMIKNSKTVDTADDASHI